MLTSYCCQNAWVHYLYAMHSKRAVILDDEPKNISRDKLCCFNREVANTRMSIYEYIHILRNDDGGYGSPDEDNDHESPDDVPVNISRLHVTAPKPPQGKKLFFHPATTYILFKEGQDEGSWVCIILLSSPCIDTNFKQDNYENNVPNLYEHPEVSEQHQQQPANYLGAADGGGMLNLLNPYDTEGFGLSLDEEMLDFQPLFEQVGQFDFNHFDMTTAPWGHGGT